MTNRGRCARLLIHADMTGLYWVAAVLALVSALHSAARLLHGWSLTVATSVVCMAAMSASLVLVAVTPALLLVRPSHPAVAWASESLGLLATWTFLGLLSAVMGDTDHPLTLVTIPVTGAASAAFLEVALAHAAHTRTGAGMSPALPAMVAQVALLAYYYPALGRIVALAWQCSRRIPVRHIVVGMQGVASAAAVELALVLSRSAVIVMGLSGTPVPGQAITVIAAAQGGVVILIIVSVTTTAWFPAMAFISRRGRLWADYWRLRPLWSALSSAAPEVQLPPELGKRFAIRYRLHRRVIEIRDAQLALRPYLRSDIADQAADAALSAGLAPDRLDAVVEAAVIVTTLDARLRGDPASIDEIPAEPIGPMPANDLGAEVCRLILVSRAIRCSPIVRRFGSQPVRAVAAARWISGLPAWRHARGWGQSSPGMGLHGRRARTTLGRRTARRGRGYG